MILNLRLIFLAFLLFFAFGLYIGEDFICGASLSPLLIIAGIWIDERFGL